jgi:retron-type reverse transcriptase
MLYGGRISREGQRLLAELLSFNGGLPMGAPTSPAIANLVLFPVDRALSTVCRRRQIAYTRYADDLTFSGDGDVTHVLPFVRRLIGELGYQLDEKKTNIYRRGRRQIVTGLVVNARPNMPRRTRRRLRAVIDARVRGRPTLWKGEPVSDRQLLGHLAFLAQTQPEEAQRLRSRLLMAMGQPG